MLTKKFILNAIHPRSISLSIGFCFSPRLKRPPKTKEDLRLQSEDHPPHGAL